MAQKVNPTPNLAAAANKFSDLDQAAAQNQNLTRTAHQELVDHAYRLNKTLIKDGSEVMEAPVPMQSVLDVDLPDPALWEGGILYNPDHADGAQPLYSDGSSWLPLYNNLPVDFSTFMLKSANLSDVANTTTARDNLGVEIGVDIMAFDPQLKSNIPITTKDSSSTLALTDGETAWYHTSATAHTWTIPANGSVAFPVGTAITFINDGTGVVTIAITTDTLVLSPAGTTGSRTLAQYGMATAVKVTSTRWFISGTGLT